eukprot:g10006.t1
MRRLQTRGGQDVGLPPHPLRPLRPLLLPCRLLGLQRGLQRSRRLIKSTRKRRQQEKNHVAASAPRGRLSMKKKLGDAMEVQGSMDGGDLSRDEEKEQTEDDRKELLRTLQGIKNVSAAARAGLLEQERVSAGGQGCGR